MARRQLQEAKNRLTVAVRKAKPRESLVEFFRKSPLAGIALEVGVDAIRDGRARERSLAEKALEKRLRPGA